MVNTAGSLQQDPCCGSRDPHSPQGSPDLETQILALPLAGCVAVQPGAATNLLGASVTAQPAPPGRGEHAEGKAL